MTIYHVLVDLGEACPIHQIIEADDYELEDRDLILLRGRDPVAYFRHDQLRSWWAEEKVVVVRP